jgi:farnesyl diphosphate synthase
MTKKRGKDPLTELLAPYADRTESDLKRWLVEPGTPGELAEAMRYCALGGGKRLRPGLTFMTAEAVGVSNEDEMVRRAAVAVELIQSYSLVHDDLPGMDNDALRRGKPTAHVQFGEAMAILVGDALLTRAFGVLCEAENVFAPRLSAELARAAGATGMVAGQVADMDLCHIPSGPEGLRYIHLRKTAALIRAAGTMGAICGGPNGEVLDAISQYAESLGLAFQVLDDVLDVTGEADEIGKSPGKDADAGKRTQVTELGLEGAETLGRRLTRDAIEALAPLEEKGRKLRTLAELLVRRTR